MVKIILIEVAKAPEIRDLPEPHLTSMQAIVGGYVDRVGLTRDDDGGGLDLFFNDEGLFNADLETNQWATELCARMGVLMDPVRGVVGNVFITRMNSEGETVDVTPDDLRFFVGAVP